MPKIVIDARELRTSSGRYVERLLNYLQSADQDNRYAVLLKPADMAGWTPLNPNFEKIPCPHKEFTFAEQFALKKQISRLQPALVHFTFAQQPVWYRGKTVTTVHDLTTVRFNNPDKNPLVFRFKQQVYKFVIKRAVRKAETVITPSQFVKEDVAAFTGINPDKIKVTYEAADPIAEPAEAVSGLENSRFIMYVGRPTPHKNLERLIEAFGRLRAQHPDLKLVLAGKMDANYRRIAAGAKNTPQIVFTDFISEGQLRWLYENCAAYVFPSLSEGFGLPGLEAMQHGAPVVSSNVTSLPEVYGDAAHYFDPLDTQSMADAINEVITDKGLRQKLVENGREQVKKYSWQRLAEQTLAIYKSSLGQEEPAA
jgi:glycosyltransferase involved in cell wall biosynthesis